MISSPLIVNKIFDSRGSFDHTMEVLKQTTGLKTN